MSFQALIISLAIHGLLSLVVSKGADWLPAKYEELAIEVLYPEDRSQQKSFVTETEAEDPLLKELKRQADYLSKFAKRVKEQQIARNTGKTQNQQESSPSMASRKKENLDLKPKLDLDSKQGLALGKVKREKRSHKNPSLLSRRVALGGSTVGEHIPGVKLGSFTSLNTDQFLYYSFFSRINEQIRYRWVDNVRRIAAQMGPHELTRLSQAPRVTEVEVLVNTEGEFIDSILVRSSGYPELDEATRSAFRKAAPFGNPPLEMADKNRVIHLHYSFRVEWSPRYVAN